MKNLMMISYYWGWKFKINYWKTGSVFPIIYLMDVKKVRVIISNVLSILLAVIVLILYKNYFISLIIILNIISIYFSLKVSDNSKIVSTKYKKEENFQDSTTDIKEVKSLKDKIDRLSKENSKVLDQFYKAFENYKAIEISMGNTDKMSKKAVSIVQDRVNSLTDGIFSLLGSSKIVTDDINSVISSVTVGEDSLRNVINNLNNDIIKIDNIVNDIDAIRIETLKESNTISDTFLKIKNITGKITELAEQTGVLAINATIEAARSGIHGKGFAVIAGEVRKLSDNSKDMAETINQMINDTHKAIENSFNKQNLTIGDATMNLKSTQESVKKISFNLNNKIEILSDSIQKSSYMSGELTEKLNGFTNSIQFLDLVRQIIEHINSIHKEVHNSGSAVYSETNLELDYSSIEKKCLEIATKHFTSKEEREALGLENISNTKFKTVNELKGDVTLF